MQLLDTENADRNLSSQVTILTHTPSATLSTTCVAYVALGDGSKDPSGTGGDYELTIIVGGQTAQPDPQLITFSTATRCAIWTSDFPVPANAQVIIKLKSPNAADVDVDCTCHLYDKYGDIYNSVVTGLPTNVTADSATITHGTVIGGTTVADTQADDGVYYTLAPIAVNGLDAYLVYTMPTNSLQNQVTINGRWSGSSQYCNVYAYRWDTLTWELLSDSVTRMNNSTSDANYTYTLLSRHRNPSSYAVHIRFASTSTNTGHRLYLDQVLVKAVVAGATAEQVSEATWLHDISQHKNHVSAGFYNSRSVIDHGDVVSASSNVVTVSSLRQLADVYNGLSIEFHDEDNDVYEVRKIVDYAINGANVDVTLDRAPYSALTTDWDAYILGISNVDVRYETDAALTAYGASKAGDAMTLSSGAITTGTIDGLGLAEIGVAVLAAVVKTGLDLKTAVEVAHAFASGNVTITGNTWSFKDVDGNELFAFTVSAGGRS